MKRILSVGGLAASLLLVSAIPAHAGLWSWLEEFSGPGPSDGTPINYYLPTTFCRFESLPSTPSSQPIPFYGLGSPPRSRARWCVFADYTEFIAPEERGFPEVTTTKWDFGYTVPLANGFIEVGAGAGFLRVSSDRSLPATQATLTPIRVAIRPLFAIRYLQKDNDWLARASSVVKFYFRENVVLGTLTGPDFGADPLSPEAAFRETNDFIRSYNVVIDLTELIPWQR